MKSLVLPATVILSALLTVGCAATEGEVVDENQTGSNASSESTDAVVNADADSEETSEESSGELDGIAEFGQAYEWEDGLSVTVSAPKTFKRDQWAAGGEKFKTHARFTVTVVNGTDGKIDTSMFSTSLQSKDKEGDEIYSSDQGLNGSPSTALLPGRQAKWDVGYGLTDINDIVLEISDWEHEAVIFTNVM